MNHGSIVQWLCETDERRLAELYAQADVTRREHVGDAVHLRGLVEISNYCARQCHYCGLRAGNATLGRYRMPPDEILACAREAMKLGYGTVVLQAGEDYGLKAQVIADIVRQIKSATPLAVTLSLGERPDEELSLWRQAGADRYLLRFETSNSELYARIHPPLDGRAADNSRDRFAILRALREMGYEIGSGVMIGTPGQTMDDLARDIEKFAELDLEMIGVGPFLPHAQTPLGKDFTPADDQVALAGDSQAPNTEEMTYKVLALTRLACPDANIPATTALATVNRAAGRELGLMRGANVVMPNLTPVKYRAMYEIYPAKACIQESAIDCHACLNRRIASIGRSVGAGRGDSPRRLQRQRQTKMGVDFQAAPPDDN